MRFLTTALTSICLLLAVSSCEENKNLPDPELTGVYVGPDWSNKGEDAVISPIYAIKTLTSSNTAILFSDLTSSKEGITLYVSPDIYHLYVYSQTTDIPVTKFSASVAKGAGGINILSAPAWFFLYKGSSTVVDGQISSFRASMTQEVKGLNLEIDAASISNTILSASAILEGVAGTLDMDTGELSNPSTTAFNFTVSGNKLTANLRLLGIIPSIAAVIPSTAQKLTITLNTRDGNGTTNEQTFVKYLGSDLVNFNTYKKTPLNLSLSLQPL